MNEEEYKAFSDANGTHHILLEDFSNPNTNRYE